MLWAHLLAYVTVTVNQELLLRNEYLGAENRILRGQIKGRLLLLEGEKATLAESGICERLGVRLPRPTRAQWWNPAGLLNRVIPEKSLNVPAAMHHPQHQFAIVRRTER